MNWLTVFNMLFSYAWLVAVLLLAWRIYRTLNKRAGHTERIESLLSETSQANAESARIAAESARKAVETIHNLLALEAKKDAETHD